MARKDSAAKVDRRNFLKGVAVAGAAAGAVTSPAANATPAANAAAARLPSALPPTAWTIAAETGTPGKEMARIGGVAGSDFMVDVIKTLDIKYLPSNCASSFRGIHESLINYGQNKMPEFLTCTHEESAVGMAHGYFKITGKPLIVGGSAGRREATGRGIVYALYQAARHLGQELRGRKVVVQGFGNVGGVAARLLWREGCTIVGISDVKGGIWKPDGMDIRQLEAHVAETGSVVGFAGSEPISNVDLITQPCDVLIPAAVGGQIHQGNADRVKAAIIAEGANGPTTPEADVVLRERGVTVIPDILANAGGVVVSYFEWVQGLQYYFWRESEITARLQEVMTRAFNRVWALATKESTDLRTAALMEGIRRVAEGYRVRGLYP